MKGLDKKTAIDATKLVIFIVVTTLATSVLVMTIGNITFGGSRDYKAEFVDATGVVKGDDVRVAGVKVGVVKDVEIAVFMRWRTIGLLIAGAISILLLVGVITLITSTQSWPLVGAWFVASGPVGVVAWSLVPTALSAVAGYLILRRATTKG